MEMPSTNSIARWVAVIGVLICVAGLVVVNFADVPQFPVLLASLSSGTVGLIAAVVYVDTPPEESPLALAADNLRNPKFRKELSRAS